MNKPTTPLVFTELIFWQEETINPVSLLSYLLTFRCYLPGSYSSLLCRKQPGVQLYSSLFHLLLTLVSFILLSQKAQILLLNPLFAWQTLNRESSCMFLNSIGNLDFCTPSESTHRDTLVLTKFRSANFDPEKN